jgi:GT2 family glycosyltransferase
MDQSRRKLNKVRRELNAVTPDQYGEPLPPQPSIIHTLAPTGDPFLIRGARKVDRAISRYPYIKHGLMYGMPANVRSRAAARPASKIKQIAFLKHEQVEVSIVIPVFNKFELTLDCLRSILKCVSPTIKFEVIVVDNNSEDETPKLSKLSNLKYIKNQENFGFVKGCNVGASQAEGEYIVFLNNDALVTEGWLEELLGTFESHQDVGLVGSKIIYPDGRLQEAGGIIYQDGNGDNYGKNDHPDRYQYNYIREVDYCSGASIIIKKALFNQLKGFDALYQPAYYEDTDLAFRIRQKSLRVLYQPKSVIYHIEGATSGTDTAVGFKKYQEINHKKFLKRWDKELKTNQYTQKDRYKARDRANKKLILIVDEHIPTPDKDSGSVRMIAIVKLLQELGYKVTFFPNFTDHRGRYTENMQQIGVEVVYGRLRFEDFVKEYGANYDAILLSRPRIGSYYMDLCQAYCVNARIIYDTVDLHYLRLARQSEYEKAKLKTYYENMSEKHKVLEEYLIDQSDTTLVVSEAELKLLNKEGHKNISMLSNIHSINTEAYNIGFENRKDILFVGGFQHLPNIDAITWFVDEVFPIIRKLNEDIKLHVAGADMPEGLSKMLRKVSGVIVDGFVPDLSDLLENSRVFIAPMRYGAGVKGKIGQAIEYGLPVVTTKIGAEGMYLKNSISCITADEPEELAKGLLELYNDKKLWLNIQVEARKVLDEHFSIDNARKDLKQILKP